MKLDMNQLMKQAQKMQKDLEKAQAEAEQIELEASSGGGMVNVKVNGKNQIVSLKIDPEAVKEDDVEMLEDLVISAVNSALEQIQARVGEMVNKGTGGFKLPGM